MSLTDDVRAALASAGLRPLHRFGQNFLIDRHALQCVIAQAAISPGNRIVEIGPGTGILTGPLLDAGAQVLAVEIDQGLGRVLEQALVPRGLQLVLGDALATKSRLNPAIEAFSTHGDWQLVANLPYDIALPAMLNAVALPQPPRQMVVTIQREAAERLISTPGADAWGATAAVLQAAGSARIVMHLGPGSFMPRPRVDSAILRWNAERPLPVGFGAWCRAVFAYRRKVLPGALRDASELTRDQAEAACHACALDPTRRLETLSSDELLRLYAHAGVAHS